MQALASVTGKLGEAGFYIEMDIFEIERPVELAGLDFLRDGGQAILNGGQIVRADDFLGGEHLGMSQRAANIDQSEALVEAYRCRIALDQLAHRFGKKTGPSG